MSASHPPRVAHWLLSRWATGPRRQSLVGDLLEQHQRGRSSAWYWRQTVSAIGASVGAEMWQHKVLAAAVAAFSLLLPDIYTVSRVWVYVAAIDRMWYPRLVHSRLSWMVINPWAYRLQPYWWTTTVAWCAMLAVLSWLMTRLRPQQRGLIVSLFLITQIGVRLPYLRMALMDWRLDPGNPIWLFSLLWFAAVTCVAVPFSILAGSAAAISRRPVTSIAG